MAQQLFNSGDTAPIVRSKLNNNANDVTTHHQTNTNPHGTSLTQAHLTVTGTVTVPDGNFVRSLTPAGGSALSDHITLAAGTGVLLSQAGQEIGIAASATDLLRLCQYSRIVISDIYGDGYLSIPCVDTRMGESFEPETGIAGFIMAAQTPNTGDSYEYYDLAYAQGYGSEGEPYDSFPMVWYDAENGPVQVDGVWRFIIQYRNIQQYLAIWCRAERRQG